VSSAPRRQYIADHALRPGRVARVLGVVFQSDGASAVGRLFIRPFEAIDRWLVGILPKPGEPSLAMHTAIHLELEDGREYVAEQLVGSFYLDFRNGLNWTPYDQFTLRDRGGWDVTAPLAAFRGLDERAADKTVERLNRIEGHPFVGEDCTAFVERAVDRGRLFADSPLPRRLGIGMRIGDPALPLLKPDAQLDQRTRDRLQFETIKYLPDALANPESLNVRLWTYRLLPIGVSLTGLAIWGWCGYSSGSRKSTPISSTARRFLR
jgi:hypothetical protein